MYVTGMNLFQVQYLEKYCSLVIGTSYCILLAGPCGRTGCTACQVPSPHKSSGDRAAPSRRLHHRFSYGFSRRALFYACHRHPGPVEGLPRKKRPFTPDATEMRPDLPLTWAVWPNLTFRGDRPGTHLEPSSDPVTQPSMTFLCWRESLLGMLLEAALIGDILNLLIFARIFISSILILHIILLRSIPW